MTIEIVDTAAPFIITELTGQKRTVRLTERGLPYRPFSISDEQRLNTTWYPGSPVATANVFGPGIEPTTIKGYWKDIFIGTLEQGSDSSTANNSAPITVNGRRIGTVREAEKLFASILREGAELEVVWDEVVRRGHMRRFSRDWQNVHDLEWSISFEWTSYGESVSSPVFNGESSVSDTTNLASAQMLRIRMASVPPFEVADEFTVALDLFLGGLDVAIASLQNASSNLSINASSPNNAARAAIAALNAVISQSTGLSDLMESQAPRAFNVSTPIELQTLGQIVEAGSYVRDVVRETSVLRRMAIIRAQGLSTSLRADLLGTYFARQGDNLRDVARIFYNDSTQWRVLAEFNGFTGSDLLAGQIVLVPRALEGTAN